MIAKTATPIRMSFIRFSDLLASSRSVLKYRFGE
jgi:hypothetical protein